MITTEMSRDEILDVVRDTFERLYELGRDEVQPESSLFDELNLDSLDAADMRGQLQQLTGLMVPQQRILKLRTVNDVISLIQELVASR